jgi:hypothetical protein
MRHRLNDDGTVYGPVLSEDADSDEYDAVSDGL